ncbi:MAG: hypothetical protein U0271_28125 [Polyangiaceae bacterium]
MRQRAVFGALFSSVLFLVACGDDTTTPGGGGAGAGGGAAGGGGAGGDNVVMGCDGATLLENPADTSLHGAWPVGARTVSIGGLTAEVWYPAVPGSEAGVSQKTYDLRDFLPPSEQPKIPDAKAPKQTCDCYSELPLDEAHGPYPIIIFVHGTAGYRAQSLELTQHWASRGFVVIAADHPGLDLADLIQSLPGCDGDPAPQDLDADLATLRGAVQAPSGDLAFLAGHVDPNLLGLTGHSAGGGAIANQADFGAVLIPMAAGGTDPGTRVDSVLVMGAVEDQVVNHTQQQNGYASTTAPKKRFVSISPAGHLVFSSLCQITNDDGEDIVKIGTDAAVCGLNLAGALFDCDPSYVDGPRGWQIVNDATSAVFEETLQCQPARAERLTALTDNYPEVAEYLEEPAP